jgi:hypothetical protein
MEANMKKKSLFAAMLALAFALALTACDGNANDNGYKFKFKVDNNTSETITKLEFINGNTRNDKVLERWTVNLLANGDRSREYSVSGFTVEATSSKRYCGVKVTFADETTAFGYSTFGHENKVLVSVGYYVSFSNGNW